jgi:hypothetical protein
LHATVVVVVEMLDVVDGGVGNGALGSNRSIEMLENAVNGFGEHGLLVVPTAPPVNTSVWLVIIPLNSLSAVHPDGMVAVSEPLKSPPVSSGFKDPPNSPVTVPVVPFPMMYTPVTLYSFSVTAFRPGVKALNEATAGA